MKIIKYVKLKNNRYKLFLDDNSDIVLYDNVILNNNLLITKKIDNLKAILEENNTYEIYFTALKYLNKKMRSKSELEKYLLKSYDNTLVMDVIKRLDNEGYLNEEVYVSSYINDQINLTYKGINKIRNELTTLGIEPKLINDKLDLIDNDIWKSRINKVISKKIKSNKNDSNIKFKDKLTYYLINLGYDKSLINECLTDIVFDEEDALTKQFNKYYNKLSKKYKDKELELHLITKLMAQGFNYNKIKNKIEKIQV